MRVAILGDHPDGLDFAQALVDSGRHELAAYSGPPLGLEQLARRGLRPAPVGDVEEILADPAIEAVIVAGGPAVRAGQLRRALQSERHVLCVHPADPSADLAYEAASIQSETGCVLLPLLAEALHPGLRRLAELARRWQKLVPSDAISASPLESLPPTQDRPDGFPRVIEVERWSTEEIVLDTGDEALKPNLPGWDVLRFLGGDLAEVFVQTAADELISGEPLLISGRFTSGGLLQASYLPNQAVPRHRLTLVSPGGRVSLDFPHGWPGPAELTYTDERGERHTERWEPLNPWAPLVEVFEEAVAESASHRRMLAPGRISGETLARPGSRLGWQDEVRCLELDDAARRSVLRRRSSTLEYVEATEEANFKSTMTLVGCGLIWASLVLLILAVWIPWLAWGIVPALAIFLGLQFFRWVVPP